MLNIEHIGSAHTDDELALLLQIAEERLHTGQLTLDLDGAGAGGASAVVEGTASLILWEVLNGLYDDLGLDSATVTIGTQQVTAQPRIPAETQTLLTALGRGGH